MAATKLLCVGWRQLYDASNGDGFVVGGGRVILVAEETDNLTCMKKSTIGGKRYMLDYEHGARLVYGYSVMCLGMC